jgi:hypothetical protein
MIYTLLSIYTSFFSLYEGFSGNTLDQRSHAIQASGIIDETISLDKNYQDNLATHDELESQINSKNQQITCKTCKDNALTNQLRREKNALQVELSIYDNITEFKKFQELRSNNFKKKVDGRNQMLTAEEIEIKNNTIIALFANKLVTDNKEKLIRQAGQSGKDNFFLFAPPLSLLTHECIVCKLSLLMCWTGHRVKPHRVTLIPTMNSVTST